VGANNVTQLEEDIKVLRQLGLTALQAQVYLTLSKLGKATIKTIATTARIDRANAYRVMSKLMKLNLVEKMITNPIVFKAVGVNEALQMLLERKAKEYQEIEAKAKDLVKNWMSANLH
jgi:sugar-specific transcriptional regulator TrmB